MLELAERSYRRQTLGMSLADAVKQHSHLLAQIGMYVIRYQAIEDRLRDLFATALGGPPGRAWAIYDAGKGLDFRTKVIAGALLDLPEDLQAGWAELTKRIGEAAAVRNDIAHGTVVNMALARGEGPGSVDIKVIKRKRATMVERGRAELTNHLAMADDLEGQLRDYHGRVARARA